MQGGKDLNWDLVHYHVYGPHSLLHGRIGRDFLAAGLQSYLNPLPHLPFYAMLIADWHSVAIAAALASMQGLALVLLYFIAAALLRRDGRTDRAAALLCTALGAAAVPFLSSVGRSFSDITTALPVLAAAWLFCAARLRTRSLAEPLALGLLLGAAAGLKLTNALFAFAAIAWPLCREGPRIQALGAYLAGTALGMLATGGYWAWLLWREFANPVFPLYNSVFRSPDFPPVDLSFERYRPRDAAGLLLAPLRMALPEPMIYGELNAPDLRLLALGLAVAALLLSRRRRAGAGALWPMLAFYAVAAVGWVATSFNARYAIALLLLAGPLTGAVLGAWFAGRALRVALAAVLALQLLAILQVSPTRLSPADPYAWTRSWLEFRVPQRLRDSPHLFLGIDRQSYSFLAAYLHPDSALAGVRGTYALHLDGPGGERLQRLLARYEGRIRSLGSNALEPGAAAPDPDWIRHKNIALGRLGLEFEPLDCLPIETAERRDWLARAANRLVGVASPLQKRFIMTCGLRRVPVSESYLRGRARADALLEAAERACPRAFPPGLARSEQEAGLWMRTYPSTERDLAWSGDELFTVSHLSGRRTSVAAIAPGEEPGGFRCPEK